MTDRCPGRIVPGTYTGDSPPPRTIRLGPGWSPDPERPTHDTVIYAAHFHPHSGGNFERCGASVPRTIEIPTQEGMPVPARDCTDEELTAFLTPPDRPSPTPTEQFRGTFAPAELFHLHQTGKISSTEFILALRIDSLVKAKGIGCFASNEHLAKVMGIDKRHLIKSLKTLKEVGLLVVTRTHPRRLMEMVWSRPLDPKGPVRLVPNGTNSPGCQKRHPGVSKTPPIEELVEKKTKTLSGALSPPAAATAAPDDGGGVDVYDGMGLVTNQQNTPAQKRVTPAPIDRYYAAKLQEALKRRLNYRKAWNQTKWADEFRVLRDTLDQDTDRLEAVLSWYCDHAGEEYVPEAFSAGSFRGKFLAVEQQMKRRLADAPLPLSPEAKEVLVRVDHLVWPKGAKMGLPNMVQRSLDNYIAFGNQLRAFSNQMFEVPGHPTLLRLQYAHIHSKVKGVYLGGNVSTIRQWVERVHELVADWDDWSGNLKPWAWSVTHKLVQQDVESLGSKVLGTGAAGQKKWADYKREVGL